MSGFLQSLFGKKDDALSSAATAPQDLAVSQDAAVSADAGALTGDASGAEPIHVTDDTFQESILNSPLPALVDFWAPWCGPCRMIAPMVDELAQSYSGRVVIAKVNTDENVQVASHLGIMGIPTLVLFKNGREVDRIVGYTSRRELEARLKAVLN